MDWISFEHQKPPREIVWIYSPFDKRIWLTEVAHLWGGTDLYWRHVDKPEPPRIDG